MATIATKLITATFHPDSLGPGLAYLEFIPMGPTAYNLSTGAELGGTQYGPVSATTGKLGEWDAGRSATGIALWCNDDPNVPAGTWWEAHYRNFDSAPRRADFAFTLSVDDPDPILLSALTPVGTAIAPSAIVDITSTHGTVIIAHPRAGVVDLHVPGGSSSPVSSVAMTGDGVVFNTSVPGSPVTDDGTLAPTLATHAANTVLAGPTTGSAAAPTFRSLVAADVPTLTLSKISDAGTAAAHPVGDFATSSHTHAHSTLTSIGTDDHHAKSHTHNGDGSGTVPYSALSGAPPLAGIGASFTANGDAYYVASVAMTLDAANPKTAGTATFTYYRALAASPTSFSAITTSTSFAVGDILKITCASISGAYAAVTLPRTS